MQEIKTPYYLIDKVKLLKNMQKMQYLRTLSGTKVLLALKCFATWSVFDLMNRYMDGTTSSSLNEVKLGKLKFGGETHAYSVAYADDEIDEVILNADKIIFNSISQLTRYLEASTSISRGLRINPGISSSEFLLADPSRPNSRLGEFDAAKVALVMPYISGFMFHNNCENHSFAQFNSMLSIIEEKFGHLIAEVQWVSLGGGIHFVADDYPLAEFALRLKQFADKYAVQVYLEPGEAAITNSASLEVMVLDVLEHGKNIAVVDASIEAHMLDLLIYRQTAKIEPNQGDYAYQICGKSCLAGDIFGDFKFASSLKIGDRISIVDAAGYTMVKKNWFNGVSMPSIVIKEIDGSLKLIKSFGFDDYLQSLS